MILDYPAALGMLHTVRGLFQESTLSLQAVSLQ